MGAMAKSRVLLGAATAAALAVGVGAYGIQAVQAQSEKEYVPKVKVTPLKQGPLAGVDGKDVIIRQFELPANHVGERHRHPGPVFVYVVEGALSIETEDGPRTIKAGELFEEPLNRTMQAKNLSATQPTKIVVFQVGDTGKPMMIKAD